MISTIFRPILRQRTLRNYSIRQFNSQKFTKNSLNHAILAVSIGASCSYILYTNFSQVKCERNIRVEVDIVEKHKKIRDDLPFYTEEEISHHNNKYHFMKTPGVDTFDIIGNAWEIQREFGIWVSYGVGVYDITQIIERHVSPETTILLAAGISLDIFFEDEDMKKVHETPRVLSLLEKSRIGNTVQSNDKH